MLSNYNQSSTVFPRRIKKKVHFTAELLAAEAEKESVATGSYNSSVESVQIEWEDMAESAKESREEEISPEAGMAEESWDTLPSSFYHLWDRRETIASALFSSSSFVDSSDALTPPSSLWDSAEQAWMDLLSEMLFLTGSSLEAPKHLAWTFAPASDGLHIADELLIRQFSGFGGARRPGAPSEMVGLSVAGPQFRIYTFNNYTNLIHPTIGGLNGTPTSDLRTFDIRDKQSFLRLYQLITQLGNIDAGHPLEAPSLQSKAFRSIMENDQGEVVSHPDHPSLHRFATQLSEPSGSRIQPYVLNDGIIIPPPCVGTYTLPQQPLSPVLRRPHRLRSGELSSRSYDVVQQELLETVIRLTATIELNRFCGRAEMQNEKMQVELSHCRKRKQRKQGWTLENVMAFWFDQ